MNRNNLSQSKLETPRPLAHSNHPRRGARPLPVSYYWWPITMTKIRRAAREIIQAVDPEKIILFGSFAYGRPTPDSDVDLLVVMKSDRGIHARTVQVSEVLRPRPFPVDIIVRTPDELKERLEIGDCFFREIVDKGVVLFERASS